jgi:hypothetical protein
MRAPITGFNWLNVGDIVNNNTIYLGAGVSNTAALVAAECNALGFEPPVGSVYISSTDGSIWQHTSAGTTAGNWTLAGLGLSGIPAGSAPVFSVTKTMNDAAWAANQVLIPGVTGKSIVLTSPPRVLSAGALTATATANAVLEDTSGTAVVTMPLSGLNGTSGAPVSDTGYTTAAIGFTGLAAGHGLRTCTIGDVTSSGSSTTITLSYMLV